TLTRFTVTGVMTALPAIILAALGLATFVAARVTKSDVVCGVLCAAGLLLAGSTLGWKQVQSSPRAEAETSSPQTGTATGQSGQATANQPTLTEDGLSLSAMWFALGLGAIVAVAAADGESNRVGARLALLLLSLAGVCLTAMANDLFLAVFAMELA